MHFFRTLSSVRFFCSPSLRRLPLTAKTGRYNEKKIELSDMKKKFILDVEREQTKFETTTTKYEFTAQRRALIDLSGQARTGNQPVIEMYRARKGWSPADLQRRRSRFKSGSRDPPFLCLRWCRSLWSSYRLLVVAGDRRNGGGAVDGVFELNIPIGTALPANREARLINYPQQQIYHHLMRIRRNGRPQLLINLYGRIRAVDVRVKSSIMW